MRTKSRVIASDLQAIQIILNQGQFEDALRRAKPLLKLQPKNVALLNLIASIYMKQKKFISAEKTLKKVLALQPASAVSHYNVALVLVEQGKLLQAVKSFQRSIERQTKFTSAYSNLGNALTQLGDFDQAKDMYTKAIELDPESFNTNLNFGAHFLLQRKWSDAVPFLVRALQINSSSFYAQYCLGRAYVGISETNKGISAFEKALELNPKFEKAQFELGIAFLGLGNVSAAKLAFRNTIALNSKFALAYFHLCRLGEASLDNSLLQDIARLIDELGETDDDFAVLNYALGTAHEKLERYAESFSHYQSAAQAKRSQDTYDLRREIELIHKVKADFVSTSDSFKPKNQGLEEGLKKPIFVVGMPRSGTTLLEQIISCHSLVEGLGELTSFREAYKVHDYSKYSPPSACYDKIREHYLSEALQKVEAAPYFIDKMPHNFLFAGAICRALPNAKIIHVHRDAKATCWSNFKHLFAAKGLCYSYDLDSTVTYYNLYAELMTFWSKQLGERILHVDYEHLVKNQEQETRRIISFLGLNWENQCLFPENNTRIVSTNSQQQVRQKVYSGSSNAWKPFEPYVRKSFENINEFKLNTEKSTLTV